MEGVARRHLDVVSARRVKGAVATDPHHGAAIGNDCFDGIRCAPRRLLDRWRHEGRQALDLAGMEQGERSQQRNATHRVLVAGILAAVPHFHALVEIGSRAAFALLHLPAAIGGLLVGGPTGVIAAEGKTGHPQRDRIDATVSCAGRGVARHARAARFVGVPRPAPGRRARLDQSHHAVCNVGVMVAPLGIASVIWLVGHWMPFPSRVC